jgi:hypothetical protein
VTRLVAIALLVVAAIAGVATWRQVGYGARAAAASDAALAASDLTEAIARARDAAEAVAPGSPYPSQGYARLEAIARGAESRADERTAVAAWGAMRSAATATAGPFVATDAWRALADDGLARAGARPPPGSAEIHASEAAIRAELARADPPATLALLLLAAGALAFFAGGARLAWVGRDLAAIKRERVALAATAAGLAIYVIASFRS